MVGIIQVPRRLVVLDDPIEAIVVFTFSEFSGNLSTIHITVSRVTSILQRKMKQGYRLCELRLPALQNMPKTAKSPNRTRLELLAGLLFHQVTKRRLTFICSA